MVNKKFIGLISLLTLMTCLVMITKNASALNLGIHIPEKYLEVVAGERLTFELEIKYPENLSRKDLKITYQIKNGDKVISEAKTLRAIETQSSFLDYMVVPESVDVGTYTIFNKVQDYQDLNEEVSSSFRVVKGKNDLMKYIYILGAAIGIVFLFVVVEFFVIFRIKNKGGKS